MTEFWAPVLAPPLISSEALKLVTAQVAVEGLINTGNRAQKSLSLTDEKLSDYLDVYGLQMDLESPDLNWHQRVLKLGAGLARHAYRETGYFQSIDEHFSTAETLANLDGIPTAYLTSLECDQKLVSLIDNSIMDSLDPALQRTDIHQVIGIGAGIVRFYLRQAVIAA